MTAVGRKAATPVVPLGWTHSASCSCGTLATRFCTGGRTMWSRSPPASARLSDSSAVMYFAGN